MSAKDQIAEVAEANGWKRYTSKWHDLDQVWYMREYRRGSRHVTVWFSVRESVVSASTQYGAILGKNKLAQVLEDLSH